jgi:hypothetical protein
MAQNGLSWFGDNHRIQKDPSLERRILGPRKVVRPSQPHPGRRIDNTDENSMGGRIAPAVGRHPLPQCSLYQRVVQSPSLGCVERHEVGTQADECRYSIGQPQPDCHVQGSLAVARNEAQVGSMGAEEG